MVAMYDRMLPEYIKELTAVKDLPDLSVKECKCQAFIDVCIDEYREAFKSVFSTTGYGEPPAVKSENFWAEVSKASEESAPVDFTHVFILTGF